MSKSDGPPWLKPWPEVADLYARMECEKDRRRREALEAGIDCRPRKEPPCS